MKNRTLSSIFAAALIACSLLTSSCCNKSCDTTSNKEQCASEVVLENIMTRKSVRAYDPSKPIEKETLNTILKAAMAAPTAVNKQPWAFVVVDDKEVIKEYAENQRGRVQFANAGALVVICGDMNKALEGEGRDFWVQDVSAACENLLLAAHAMGIGAVWTGVYPISQRVAEISKFFNLPEEIIPMCVVVMGYPAEDPAPKDKWIPENIHWNKW